MSSRRWVILLVAAAVAVALIATVVHFLWFDRTNDVARALVLGPDKQFDEPAISGALAGRFPNGTSVTRVREFIEGFGGSCYVHAADFNDSHPKDTLFCSVVVSGTFCVNSGISLRAHIGNGDAISDIAARRYYATC